MLLEKYTGPTMMLQNIIMQLKNKSHIRNSGPLVVVGLVLSYRGLCL